MWIAAHLDRRGRIAAALLRFELDKAAVSFVGKASGIGLSDAELVARAWDLDSVSRDYRAAMDRFAAAPEPESGPDAVRLLLQVDGVLQDMVSQDPWLPSELCEGWTGRQDAAGLLAYRDALLVPARVLGRAAAALTGTFPSSKIILVIPVIYYVNPNWASGLCRTPADTK
ncbi:PaaX family transcriptional regulator C-terminal domain-containing protein [Rhodococcus opacus]|nr:PaaX family transcriptional regulator C-terminal domain-containing protein [Rhodococcus sp. LB1]WKN60686.1 PaaX family transcriptional regulator C-terminal domain-containing protein [Rhodococcus opacus]